MSQINPFTGGIVTPGARPTAPRKVPAPADPPVETLDAIVSIGDQPRQSDQQPRQQKKQSEAKDEQKPPETQLDITA